MMFEDFNQKAQAIFTETLLRTESYDLAIKAEKDFRKANRRQFFIRSHSYNGRVPK